jgi:hypothetical protein
VTDVVVKGEANEEVEQWGEGATLTNPLLNADKRREGAINQGGRGRGPEQ